MGSDLFECLLLLLLQTSSLLLELLQGALSRGDPSLLNLAHFLALGLAVQLLIHDALRAALETVIPDLDAILAVAELALSLTLHLEEGEKVS